MIGGACYCKTCSFSSINQSNRDAHGETNKSGAKNKN